MTWIMSQVSDAFKQRDREILGIQYLRAVAAIAVVFDHAAGMAAFPKYFGQTFYTEFFSRGASGVTLFFMISGFIISIVSLRPYTLERRMSLRDFVLRRFARIVPIMWIAIISYMALRYAATGEFYPASYLNAFFLIPFGDVDPNNIWTLRHEMIFYVVFGLSFLTFLRLRWLMAIWVLSPILLYFAVGPVNRDTVLLDLAWTVFSPVNVYFGVGMLIGFAWLKGLKDRTRRVNIDMFAVFSVAFVAAMFVFYSLITAGAPVVLLMGVSISIFIAIVLASIVFDGPANRVGLFLGSASYSIYLFHPHFESAALSIWSKIAPASPIGLVVVAVSLMAIVASSLVYIFVELPVVRISQRLLLGSRDKAKRVPSLSTSP